MTLSSVLRESATAELPDAAQALARAGLEVFPCQPGTKRPLTRHGFYAATTDRDRIGTWWDRCPDANIGVRTGRGIDVLDIDRHGQHSGYPILAQLQRAALIPAWLAAIHTPSGGLHLYFATTTAQSSWSRPKVQIDFRGTGGYVIVPPSQITTAPHERTGYVIAATQQQAGTLDANLLRDILSPPAPSREPHGATASGRDSLDRLTAWVAALPEGSRNTGLFWAACRVEEQGLDGQILHDAAVTAGLDPAEADATLRSAARTIAQSPQDHSPGIAVAPVRGGISR